MRLPVAILLLLLFSTSCLAVNPVKTPLLKGGLRVHVQPFVKLPNFQGEPARVISMVGFARVLYVCTLTTIYAVDRNGKYAVFLDAAQAFQSGSGRKLSIANKKHGGVRSLAFHPQFKKNGLIYLSAMEERPASTGGFTYISDVPNHISADSVVVEFRVNQATMKPIVSSYRVVFRVGMPVFDHPIKQIAFYGRFLYIAHGDGSVQSAVAGGGQKNDALGKILRINPLKKGNKPYTVPSTNPFLRVKTMKKEVYALGFRNPHHICFGKDGTLYSADAGRSNVEEVNLVKKGKNYGWPLREGTFVHAGGGLISGIRPLPSDDAKNRLEYPNAQVGHEGPFRAGFIGQAIAGACPVENGSPLSGYYFYSDFPETGTLFYSKISELKAAVTTGRPNKLRQARTWQATIVYNGKQYDTLRQVMRTEAKYRSESRIDCRFGRGSRGELYVSAKGNGRVYLITSSLPGGPGGV